MKKKKTGVKELVIICLILLLSWLLCFYFTRFADESLIPLGDIMLVLPLVVLMLFVLILSIKDLIFKLNKKRKIKNRKDIRKVLFELISTSLILFICLYPCLIDVKDMVEGPKELTLYNVKMIRERIGRHPKCYLIGTTMNDTSKKLKIVFLRQSISEMEELIQNNLKLKVYYFENSNTAYYIEETEWELQKPSIDIIETK